MGLDKRIDRYFKCMSDDYTTYEKGKIYLDIVIGSYIYKHPLDWKEVLQFPTNQELIDCIKSGKNKTKVLKALTQWKNN